MTDWRPHRVWILLLGLALVIGAGNAPALGFAQHKAAQKLAGLRIENAQAADALRQLQSDLAAAETMKTQIDIRETEKVLAPVDRLRAAETLERRATEARLTRFTYTLSPEQKTTVTTVGAGKQDLATSQLTLTADAPTDTDAYVFLDTLSHALPGRLTLRAFSLQRIAATDAPLSDANLRLTARGEWLSNGASPNLAEDAR